MYNITISRAQWFDVQKYLEHNYWCNRQDYTYFHRDYTVELTCLKPDLYELILARFKL